MSGKKLDRDRCYVEWYKIDYGQWMLVARSRDHAAPIGLVWGLASCVDKKAYGDALGKVFEVYGSYIPHFMRRLGVRTMINQAIFEKFDVIRTASATKEGAKFLAGSGYKRDPLGGYFRKL